MDQTHDIDVGNNNEPVLQHRFHCFRRLFQLRLHIQLIRRPLLMDARRGHRFRRRPAEIQHGHEFLQNGADDFRPARRAHLADDGFYIFERRFFLRAVGQDGVPVRRIKIFNRFGLQPATSQHRAKLDSPW